MKALAILLMLLFLLFIEWIFCLIDVLRHDFKVPSNKTAWLLALLFIPPLATILYGIFGRKQRIGGEDKIIKPNTSHIIFKPKDSDPNGWRLQNRPNIYH